MMRGWLAALALLSSSGSAQDVAFDAALVDSFVEYSETPLKTITQVGPHKSPKQPVRDIEFTAAGRAKASAGLPLMHIVTAPGCGACNRLKSSVNRGEKVRALLPKFNTVYLNGPCAPLATGHPLIASCRQQLAPIALRLALVDRAGVACLGRTSGRSWGTRATSRRCTSTLARASLST